MFTQIPLELDWNIILPCHHASSLEFELFSKAGPLVIAMIAIPELTP